MTRHRATRKKSEVLEDQEPLDPQARALDLGRPTQLLLTVLPLVAAALTAGGVCLHAIGAITHRVFSNEMGIPSDLFPKDVAWTLINGYYALFDRWHLLFKVLTDETWKFIGYSFVITSIVLLYRILFRWNPKGWEHISGWPTWKKETLRFFSLSIAIVGTIPGAVSAILLAILIVGAPGEYAGRAYAEKLRNQYKNGCTPEASCTTILKGGTPIITGAVLDASANHIALYDPKTRTSHVLEAGGVELRRHVLEEK